MPKFVRMLMLLALCICLRPLGAADYHSYAEQSFRSFLLKFWNGNDQYFHHTFPDNGSTTGYWTYANGWAAVLDNIERTNKKQYLNWIETLYIGQNERGWNANYYDDLCWMTLALTRSYDLTGDTKYLDRAKSVFANVQGAWDTSCCGNSKGGVWWDTAHTQKATASNAGAAVAAAKLYRRTAQPDYLTFARQTYDYWRQTMTLANGQVIDHITTSGEKVGWVFTYNQGLMIEAAIELNEATGETTFLTQAYLFASYLFNYRLINTAYGVALDDGNSSSCQGDCAQFKGPTARALARLYAKDRTRASYMNLLRGSADSIWNLARNTNDVTFSTSWGGPPEALAEMTEQNSAVTALSLYAQLAQPYSGVATNIFEAEEAIIHHIPLEANYGTFTGWGYVAGWNHNGQSLDFPVEFATAGNRTVRIRYAAGAGDATRAIRVNNTAIAANRGFPNTGAWSTYNSVAQSLPFPAGKSVITLSFESALGSQNWLNLDSISIDGYTPPAPGKLTVTSLRPNITVTWFTPGVLQMAEVPTGPWSDVIGNPASPATLALSPFTRFYRLRQ